MMLNDPEAAEQQRLEYQRLYFETGLMPPIFPEDLKRSSDAAEIARDEPYAERGGKVSQTMKDFMRRRSEQERRDQTD